MRGFKFEHIVILILGGLLLWLTQCRRSEPIVDEIIKTEVVTKWDTVEVEKTEYVPKIIEKVVVNIDTFTAPIDTVSVLEDYYAKYFYTDTIQIDTLGSVVINDSITRNLISFRDVQSNIFIPTTTVTNTVYLNRREFYGGISVTGRPNQLDFINGELLYRGKKRNAYGIGAGINNQLEPVYTVKMYWRIGK
jgi:hypothetical protein